MLPSLWRGKNSTGNTAEGEDEEALLPDTEQHQELKPQPTRRPKSLPIVLIVVLSYGLVAILGVHLGRQWPLDAAALCTKLVSRYSPAVKDLGISYHTVQYNGSFFNLNVFRHDAGPEVDAAWESLGVDYRSARLPADQAKESGLMSDQVRIKEKYGGGYPANVEGLHHLHCLNLLRKALYYNFEYYHDLGQGAFQNDDIILKNHITHCLDILRQQLMCTVDMGMLGQVWWDPQDPKTFVDFNTKHVCRNFEAVRKWAEQNQLPAVVPVDLLVSPGDGDTIYDVVP